MARGASASSNNHPSTDCLAECVYNTAKQSHKKLTCVIIYFTDAKSLIL